MRRALKAAMRNRPDISPLSLTVRYIILYLYSKELSDSAEEAVLLFPWFRATASYQYCILACISCI
jgi:hypothetical protein